MASENWSPAHPPRETYTADDWRAPANALLEIPTIALRDPDLQRLVQRARRRGISVTELMRRAVALDAVVFDPDHPTREIVLRDGDAATERILHPL